VVNAIVVFATDEEAAASKRMELYYFPIYRKHHCRVTKLESKFFLG